MGERLTHPKPHSEIYFNPARSHWWNDDFIALMAQRTQLGSARTLLDVGCGVGHWHRLLIPALAPDFTVTAVDREPRWVHECNDKTQSFITGNKLQGTITTVQSDAHSLPFGDSSFDVVTCQTLLIHLRDPALAVRDFVRVSYFVAGGGEPERFEEYYSTGLVQEAQYYKLIEENSLSMLSGMAMNLAWARKRPLIP